MYYTENGNAKAQFICSKEKPNVFLIGDSIRLGYCASVKEILADTSEVFYVSDNCRNTQYVITNLYTWANMFDNPNLVNIVHFNCGHWDIAHWNGCELPLTSEKEYSRNIEMIINLIEKLFVNAKIVFATTTTMNPNGTIGINPRTNDQIVRYNKLAKAVADEHNIIINDIYSVTEKWDSNAYCDYCHFTESAFKELGEAVAFNIKNCLQN